MRIAVLSPIAWRTPPRHYGPWEKVASIVAEGLVNRGFDVTLFATEDSLTAARLKAVSPHGYEEDQTLIPKVWESLHISALFEEADQYDIIHNHFDFLPLTFTGMTTTPVVTTIHGFSSPGILPVYRKYDGRVSYVSISNADRAADLSYVATVYHGIELDQFTFEPQPDEYLLFLGRIHNDKGVREAIQIARGCNRRLIIAGIVQDQEYHQTHVAPELSEGQVEYVGSVGPEKRDHLLGKAFAVLHPIQFDEPFGLSVVESMACGTPVIAFNRGSMPELIDHGRNGFVVSDVNEAIRAVGEVPGINRVDCRQHVERYFTAERMVDEYVKVYETVLEQATRESVRTTA